MPTVLPRHRLRQPQHISTLSLPHNSFKPIGGDIMAFINDDMAVISDQIGNNATPNQALYDSEIDDACWFFLSAVYDANFVWFNVQKDTKTCDPLIKQLAAMNEDESVSISCSDHLCRDNGLAERSGREHPDLVS